MVIHARTSTSATNKTNVKRNHLFKIFSSIAYQHQSCLEPYLSSVSSLLCAHIATLPRDSLYVLIHQKVAVGGGIHQTQACHIVDGLTCRPPSTNAVPKCVWLTANPACTHKHRYSPPVAFLFSAHTNKGIRCDLAKFGVKRHQHGSCVDPGREICVPAGPQLSLRATLTSS